MAGPGRLYIVPTPIGNLEDITLRGLRVLREVSVVAAEDTRAAQHLLGHHGLWPRQGLELWSFFEGNEREREAGLLAVLAQGRDVALISEAGMPGVSDPGQALVAAAAGAGYRVEVLPGPSAALAALVGSGLPTERFVFLGFPPRKQGPRQELFGSLRAEPGTLVLYEAPLRVARTLADLAAALGGQRRACVARELTKVYEEYVRGDLAALVARYAEAAPRGEVTLVVAGAQGMEEVVDLEAEVRALLAAGQGPREIAAALALRTGKGRRQIYQYALSLRRSEGG